MDEYTAALLKEAFDLNDLACEQYERLERRTRQAAQAPRLIHKTYEGPQPVQQQSDLDAATMQRSDSWLDRRVREHTDVVIDVVAEEAATLEKRLRDELATLRAEVEVLRAMVKGENVTPIGHKNVA